MNGQNDSQRVKRGRPKKKPGYSRDKEIDDLIQQAVKLFCVPYDDRDERSPDAPTIQSVATAMNTSRVRVKKLLITADYYSSKTSRKVQSLIAKGYTIDQIIQTTGLSTAGVNAVLPYKKGAYKLEEPHPYAENCRLFRKRKRACEQLIEHLDTYDDLQYLWEAILAFENYPFQMKDGRKFKYRIDGDSIRVDTQTFTKSEIEEAFCEIRPAKRGRVEIICTDCSVELYVIFLRIGAYE